MRIATITLISFLAFATNIANAELKATSPIEVCAYLKDSGLSTRGWKNKYDNVFGCSSSYKEIGSGFPLSNNLAYYVEGNSKAVSEIKLVLNVNNRESAKSAQEELLKTAEVLNLKTSGQKLPQVLKDAIKIGKNATAKVGSVSIEIVREDWSSGKGYELKISMK